MMEALKIELKMISKSDAVYATTKIHKDEAKYLLEQINKPDLSIDTSLRHLVVNKDKLDFDHLMALGGIVASCKEDDTYTSILSIDKCIEYLKENSSKINSSQQEGLFDLNDEVTRWLSSEGFPGVDD